VLEVVDREIDLVILDRGFFDALIWLELQRSRRQVTGDEADAFAKFVLLDRWRKLVDVTVVMAVDPKVAMKREQKDKLIPRRGSVMKETALTEFNIALSAAREAYGQQFRILERSSEAESPKAVAAALVQDLLAEIELWADPEIAVVPAELVRALFAQRRALPWSTDAWDRLVASATAMKRSKAEADGGVVQLVACGVPIRPDGVFVFDRTRDKKRLGEYGAYSVWNGQHVELGAPGGPVDLEVVRDNLSDRVRTKLHLNFEFDLQPLGIVWVDDQARARSKHHLGVVFAVRIDDENVAQSLEDKEFRTRGRGHPATSKFSTIEALKDPQLDLEPWSRQIVESGWLSEAQAKQ
jgi:predicted NUDIX family phosphoesterase